MEISTKPTTSSRVLSILVVLFSIGVFAIAWGVTYSEHGGSGPDDLEAKSGDIYPSLRQVFCPHTPASEPCKGGMPISTLSGAMRFTLKPWTIIVALISAYLTILLFISRTGKWIYFRSFLVILGWSALLAMMWIHHDTFDAKDKEEYPLSSSKNHNICTRVIAGSFLLLMLINLYVYFKDFKTGYNLLYIFFIISFIIFLILFSVKSLSGWPHSIVTKDNIPVYYIGIWEIGLLLSYILSNLVIGFATSKKK